MYFLTIFLNKLDYLPVEIFSMSLLFFSVTVYSEMNLELWNLDAFQSSCDNRDSKGEGCGFNTQLFGLSVLSLPSPCLYWIFSGHPVYAPNKLIQICP